MIYGTNSDGTTRDVDQWRTAVATKVHRWNPYITLGGKQAGWAPHGGGQRMQFRPDESAADDMLALEAVLAWPIDWREAWDTALYALRHADGRVGGEKSYRPGDWSAAALAVIEERESKA